MNIRRAVPADVERITDIWWSAMLQEHLGYDPSYYAPKPEKEAKALKQKEIGEILGGKNSFVLVADDNGVIGYSAARIDLDRPFIIDSIGYISNVAVLKEHREKGVGRKLLDETVRELKKMGAKTIGLTVDLRNAAAIKLYKEAGFVEYYADMRLIYPAVK
jgi:ribosomal protein S18 acetylase RimI-like enzyme